MAIVTVPLLSFSAKGQIGKAIVYSSWNTIDYAKKYTSPTDANTAAQQVIRGYFKSATVAWHGETTTVKNAWLKYAKDNSMKMTGYNLYVSKFTQFMVNNSGTPPTVTNTPPNMS